MTDLTPELTALVTAARGLVPELIRQVTDFAEFLGRKYAGVPAPVQVLAPTLPPAAAPTLAPVQSEEDDDVVDLGVMDVGKERLDLSGVFSRHDRLDLSGVYSNTGMHSAIGMV